MASGDKSNDIPRCVADLSAKICEAFPRHDQRGMELLYDAFYRRSVLWANTFLDDPQAAEDLVQELFVDIWDRKLYLKFRKGAIFPFLSVLIRNRCLNHKKKRGVVFAAVKEENVAAALDNYDYDHDRLYSEIISGIESLHPRSSQVLQAVYLDGMKYREVAERYDISVSTVKTLISRALDNLRRRIQQGTDG